MARTSRLHREADSHAQHASQEQEDAPAAPTKNHMTMRYTMSLDSSFQVLALCHITMQI